jgi:predicted Zn-dependent protease
VAHVEAVGERLLVALKQMYAEQLGGQPLPYEFSFTLLEDDNTVNAFALPGGPTFITEALYKRLETEGQLAGVMGHEIGHVVHRHGAERMAKQQLTQGLTGAAVMVAGDPSAQQVASMVGNFIMMSYGREDELECDAEGIELMVRAGYDPRSMVGVMKILKEASGGGGNAPEWASTHPHPENRIELIEQKIQEMYPDGVPEGLKP